MTPPLSVADLSPDAREDFEERAAIMEHDALMPRAEAERRALECVTRRRVPVERDPAAEWIGAW